MAQNYASKFSSKVDERFALDAKTAAAVNNDYDFVGVNVVNVYSIATSALNDYTMTGTSRYGTPAELNDTKQTLTLSKDQSFTFTIDRRNAEDSAGAKAAGVALARQLREVIIPTVDKYRIGQMIANAGTTKTGAIAAGKYYDAFLDAQNVLLDNSVPEVGRIAYVSPDFYKGIKLDPSFIRASDMAQEMAVTGAVGAVDGVAIIPVPWSYFNATDTEAKKISFVITHPVAMPSPVKIADYKIHNSPPGISGDLVEGRIYYDAFVLGNKAKAIYVHRTAAAA